MKFIILHTNETPPRETYVNPQAIVFMQSLGAQEAKLELLNNAPIYVRENVKDILRLCAT
jgi:hypothetical protein